MEHKKKLLDQIILELDRERQTLIHAALTAKEAATHEESKAEDKYDTRGLEASYLAGAQAKRATDLEKLIFDLTRLELKDFGKDKSIEVSAIVKLLINDSKESRVFLVPHAGGINISDGSQKIQVVTPSSPLGRELIGRKRGEDFELKIGKQSQSVEIIDYF